MLKTKAKGGKRKKVIPHWGNDLSIYEFNVLIHWRICYS
jgi:hypothetical protein